MNAGKMHIKETEVLHLLVEAKQSLEAIIAEGPRDHRDITPAAFLQTSERMDRIQRMLQLLVLQAKCEQEERPGGPALISAKNVAYFEEIMTGILRYSEMLRLRFETAPPSVN